jgi:hypothetical protein
MDRNMHFDSPMTLYSIVHDIVGFVLIVIDVCTKININSQHSQAELPPRLYHLVLSCMSYQLYVYRPNISFDHHRNSQNAIHQRNRRTFSYFGSNSNRNHRSCDMHASLLYGFVVTHRKFFLMSQRLIGQFLQPTSQLQTYIRT